MLAFTLTAFLELMDHGIVSWDMVSITFIKQVRPPIYCLSPPSVASSLDCPIHSGEAQLYIPWDQTFHPQALVFLWILKVLHFVLQVFLNLKWVPTS
jgi:hypothetical protein